GERPASSIALRLASRARFSAVVPDWRVNAVQPMPTMAVLSLIACSGMSISSLFAPSPLAGEGWDGGYQLIVHVYELIARRPRFFGGTRLIPVTFERTAATSAS